MGKFASGLYLIAATACYLLAAINIHLLLDRGQPLAWVNLALAVVLGVAGIVLSCLAARSSQTEVVCLWVDEPGSIDERSWARLGALKGDRGVAESETGEQERRQTPWDIVDSFDEKDRVRMGPKAHDEFLRKAREVYEKS